MSAHTSPDIPLEHDNMPLSDPQLHHERDLSDHENLEQVIFLFRASNSIFLSTLAH